MNLPKQVEIVEVSPRDGLQMLPLFVPTTDKIKLIELAKDAGFRRIEAVSFVSPKHVPQMADAVEILQAIGDDPQIDEVALALNEKGYKWAISEGVDWICYVMAATETFSQKNANTTIADSLAMTKNVSLKPTKIISRFVHLFLLPGFVRMKAMFQKREF